ncbi:MAG: hypothetical protein AAFX98_09650 [Pseudomonadota bacterium]
MDAEDSATNIATRMIITTGQSLMVGDFDAFSACFEFPLRVETTLGTNTVVHEDQLRETFDSVRAHYRRLGVQNMERECLSAEFEGPDTISTVHETRLIVSGGIEQRPFTVLSTLVRRDHRWVITDTKYSISDSLTYVRALTQ